MRREARARMDEHVKFVFAGGGSRPPQETTVDGGGGVEWLLVEAYER